MYYLYTIKCAYKKKYNLNTLNCFNEFYKNIVLNVVSFNIKLSNYFLYHDLLNCLFKLPFLINKTIALLRQEIYLYSMI